MRIQNFQIDERRELDEESFLRTLGIDELDIEMIIDSKREAARKWRKEN